ncbi:MAG: hypothetical protein ACOYM4_05840 [Nodosilinea sp.]
MVQTLPIEQLTLYDLEQQFGLQEVVDAPFKSGFANALFSQNGREICLRSARQN